MINKIVIILSCLLVLSSLVNSELAGSLDLL